MQQLSLFDFGDEPPKPENKKRSTKKSQNSVLETENLKDQASDGKVQADEEPSLISNLKKTDSQIGINNSQIIDSPLPSEDNSVPTDASKDIENKKEPEQVLMDDAITENNSHISSKPVDKDYPNITDNTASSITKDQLPLINSDADISEHHGEKDSDQNKLIFSNENIGVKIKYKTVEVNNNAAAESSTSNLDSNENNVIDSKTYTLEKPIAIADEVPTIKKEAKFIAEDKIITVKKRGRKSFKEMDMEVDLLNIPSDEELFQKKYYPISVVAKWFHVNNSLLRFWENEFKILKPKKNKKGDRYFRPEDVKNLQLIYYLLRQKKLTISGAVKHLKANKENTEVNLQMIQSLNTIKGFFLELKVNTEKL